MIVRCTDSANDSYARYGGRGIAVCDEWRHDFQAFHDYVTQLPNYGEKDYTLDRIDNNGNYEPGNVRWATPTQQNRNTRTNRTITYNGETKCLAEWASTIGIQLGTLWYRLHVGWSVEAALTTPLDSRNSGSRNIKSSP